MTNDVSGQGPALGEGLGGGLLLTDLERRRFAEWLEREALTARGLCKQMEGLGAAHAMLADHERRYAAAAALIADRLRRTESMSIG